MAVRPLDPQIANRVKARNAAAKRNLYNQSWTERNAEGLIGASSATPTSRHSGYNVDAGERDAPKFPPAFTGKGVSGSAAMGNLEGLTGQFGSALGKASREAEAAARAARFKTADNYESAEFGVGGLSHAARDIARNNRRRNMIRDQYGVKGDLGNAYELADAGSLGITPLGNETGQFVETEKDEIDTTLDTIETDLFGGGTEFGDLRTLQNALVKLRGSLNANQLQRSRRLEDYALALDKYRRQSDLLRRQIPGGFNRKGMLNSGQFDRGMGEFEGQVIRDELEQKHRLQRVMQDLGFADRSAGYEFDETIRENAIEGALASAAKSSALSVPGMEGGYTPVGQNKMNQYGESYMDSLIKSIYGA